MESLIGNVRSYQNRSGSDLQKVENSLRSVMQFVTSPPNFVDRRSEPRVPFTQLFPATPVEGIENMRVCGETLYVVGKNLSPSGIGFFHHEAIPSRYVVISLPQDPHTTREYLVRLSWCRFLHPGWYDSGGQILQIVDGQV